MSWYGLRATEQRRRALAFQGLRWSPWWHSQSRRRRIAFALGSDGPVGRYPAGRRSHCDPGWGQLRLWDTGYMTWEKQPKGGL